MKAEYRQAALQVKRGGSSCCGSVSERAAPITSNLYEVTDTETLPAEAVLASLGCGNPTVLAELKPGGRIAVLDVVVRGDVPAEIRHSVELWMGCVAGALEESAYRSKLAKAGFRDIEIVPPRVYRAEDAKDFLAGAGLDVEVLAPQMDGKFMSAFIRARKPLESELRPI